VGVNQRVPNAGLGRQVHYPVKTRLGEKFFDPRAIGDIQFDETEIGMGFQPSKPISLQFWIVVIVEVIQTDNLVAALEQALRGVHADESGSARDKYFHSITRKRISGVHPENSRPLRFERSASALFERTG
jgi:hypothetical protein